MWDIWIGQLVITKRRGLKDLHGFEGETDFPGVKGQIQANTSKCKEVMVGI